MRRLAVLIPLSLAISGCHGVRECQLIGAVRDADRDGLKRMLHDWHDGNVVCDGVDIFTVAAVSRDGYDSAVLLTEAGVRPMRGDGTRTTALHEAAMWADLRMVRLLLAHGLDPFSTDGAGATPLEVAKGRRDRAGVEIAEYLQRMDRAGSRESEGTSP